jgi:hypothetical protein
MAITVFPEFPKSSDFSKYKNLATVTSSTTWSHPEGASALSPKEVFVVAIGGGGGGGSGAIRVYTSGTTIYPLWGGGGGGSSGASFGKTTITGSIPITIGAGGAGGAAVTPVTNNNSILGNAGLAGGFSQFQTSGTNSLFTFRAINGRGGQRGSTVSVPDQFSPTPSLVQGGGGGNQGGEGSVIASQFATDAVNFVFKNDAVLNSFIPGAGGGGAGHWYNGNNGYNFPSLSGYGGKGLVHPIGTGGNGGTSEGTRSGANATGYGSGGGGGGGAVAFGLGASSGAGGNGAPGVVYIYY